MVSIPRAADPLAATPTWRPAALHVYGVYRRQALVWVRDGRTGERVRRQRSRYDVRYRVDDREYRFGFDQKGWADDFARQLSADFAHGLRFDASTRRFSPPLELEQSAPKVGPSFYSHAQEFVRRQWHRWSPGTRPDTQREIARACLQLVGEDSPPLRPSERLAADRYLRRTALIVPQPEVLTVEDHGWRAWFERWSLPITEITDDDLRRFLDVVRSQALDGTPRELSKSSTNRTRMIVRRVFVSARQRRLIEWDPWEAIEAEPMRDHDQADPDLVMDITQVRALARECGVRHPRYEAFVLIQGLCGLRPGEALDVRRRDLDLDSPSPSITLRGSYSAVASHFFTGDETRRRPLKGRGSRASRSVPLPAELVALLRPHVIAYVADGRDALVFTNASGGRISLSNFGRDVWSRARQTLFSEDDPLRSVRRHDLRHSAITAWLNAGVPLKTAQLWSGHKTASVLLNTYLGVLRGDESLARERWATTLAATSDTEAVTGS